MIKLKIYYRIKVFVDNFLLIIILKKIKKIYLNLEI